MRGVLNPLLTHLDLYWHAKSKRAFEKPPFLETLSYTPLYILSKIRGTDVITVGRSTDASPLVPCLILLEESIIVSGVEYPTKKDG